MPRSRSAGSSRAKFESLSDRLSKAGKLDRTFVNCSRNSWPGYGKIREFIRENRKRTGFHLEVTGNLWGLGCNTVHFLDLFRFFTDAKEIRSVGAQLSTSPQGNKRGSHFEEFIGTASFKNDLGDSIQITSSGSQAGPSGIFLTLKERTGDEPRFYVSEDAGWAVDLPALSKFSLEAIYVSKSTKLLVDGIFSDPQNLFNFPTFKTAALAHHAFYIALEAATGKTEFGIT